MAMHNDTDPILEIGPAKFLGDHTPGWSDKVSAVSSLSNHGTTPNKEKHPPSRLWAVPEISPPPPPPSPDALLWDNSSISLTSSSESSPGDMPRSKAYDSFKKKLKEWRVGQNTPEARRQSHPENNFDICTRPFAFLEAFAHELHGELNAHRQANHHFVPETRTVDAQLSRNIFAMLGGALDHGDGFQHMLNLQHEVGSSNDANATKTVVNFSSTNRRGGRDRIKLTAQDIQAFLYSMRNVLSAHDMAEPTLVDGCFPLACRARVRAALEQQFLLPVTTVFSPIGHTSEDVEATATIDMPLDRNPCRSWAADMLFLLNTMEARLPRPSDRTLSSSAVDAALSQFLTDMGSNPAEQASYAIRLWVPRMVQALAYRLMTCMAYTFEEYFGDVWLEDVAPTE